MTTWTVQSRGKLVWLTANCDRCHQGISSERLLRWEECRDDAGQVMQIDGKAALKPVLSTAVRFIHCRSVEEPSREVWERVLVAMDRRDLVDSLLPQPEGAPTNA